MGSIFPESHDIWAISRLGYMDMPIEDPDETDLIVVNNGIWAISGQADIYEDLSAIYPKVGNHEPILATYMWYGTHIVPI